MSGHSKWSTIKHKKAINDAKRANIFTKLAKDVTIAAREGGRDPEANFRLRMAMDKAKSANMPKDNIERAIKRGTGELKDGAVIEETIYEAYGPGQIAMLIKTTTDNKNRTLSETKSILLKNGGKFVTGGSVSWQFEQVGSLAIENDKMEAEELEIKIIESGAKDYVERESGYLVFTLPKQLQKTKLFLESAGAKVVGAELIYLAKDQISIDQHTRMDYEKLLEALDESDDVAEVWDNLK